MVAPEADLEIRTENGVRYLVQFPVGDWSDAGHGKCSYFFALSQQPLTSVREAHFQAPASLGFSIGDICRDFDNSRLAPGIQEKLVELQYTPAHREGMRLTAEMQPEDIADIWLFCLNAINPALQLRPVEMPSIQFFGEDAQSRHLETPGYGLFARHIEDLD